MTLEDLHKTCAELQGVTRRAVVEYTLTQAEIDALKAQMQMLEGYGVALIYGIKLVPNPWVRSVKFADGSWALLNPGTLEWDEHSVFPPTRKPFRFLVSEAGK